MKRSFLSRVVAVGVLSGALAACSDATSMTAPEAPAASAGVTPLSFQEVTVCTTGPEGTWAKYKVTATGGTLLHGSYVAIEDVKPNGVFPAACMTVWRSTGPEVQKVTVTEIERSPGTLLEQLAAFNPYAEVDQKAAKVAVKVSGTIGAMIVVRGKAAPDGPPPFDACRKPYPPNGGNESAYPPYPGKDKYGTCLKPYPENGNGNGYDPYPGKDKEKEKEPRCRKPYPNNGGKDLAYDPYPKKDKDAECRTLYPGKGKNGQGPQPS